MAWIILPGGRRGRAYHDVTGVVSVEVLQVLQGPDRGKRLTLPPNEPQLIGRSSESMPITDSTVSRRHAELTPDNGTWYLRDLDSANGTYINGRRLTDRVALSPGDQIRCGSTLLLFMPEPDDRRSRLVQLLPEEAFDVTVERTMDVNEESMILGAPDPVQAASDHLRVIYGLTALTATAFERDELLEKVMDLIFEEFRPERGFILLQAGPEGRPDPVVVRYRQKPRDLDEGRIPVSRTIINHTLQEGEGILSTNAMNDQRFRSGDSVRDYGIRSAICVPIRSPRRIFGVIHIDSSLAAFTFSESQLRLMNAIGQHTGLALTSVDRVKMRVQTERLAAMGQTVASLSHSIKNILQGLRGGADAVELALNRGDLALAREGWPILARNLDRTLALTLNMLAYARPPQLDIEIVYLAPLIDEVLQLLRPQCQRKRIGILRDLDESMPPIPADANALHQALMNLLTNAVEALPSRDGVITVSTRYLPDHQQAEITVADNGPGIPVDRQETIFEAFATDKGQRGTGLGLAVTRKIVQEHGGTVELRSGPGAGAAFSIRLPVDRQRVDPADTSLPRAVPREELDDPFRRRS
jgi:signal transduction histidine kinase/pSer/pThr/pTyr-binding forkhead associated (FHA) protein